MSPKSPEPKKADYLKTLLQERRSVRAFLPQPLQHDTLTELLSMAQAAPSWCNIQPWRLALTDPPTTALLSAALMSKVQEQGASPEIPFPAVYPEPYKRHRRSCGGALFRSMGIAREDRAQRREAWLRNYQFFGAPHVLMVSRDRRLGEYATLDLGVWLGALLLAAESLGVHTCPMASVAAYPDTVREVLNIPDTEVIVVGVALGTADPDAPANRTRTQREPIDSNLRFVTQD